MRIQIFSDLHLECAPPPEVGSDAEVVVAAGDIGHGLEGIEWLKGLGRPVVYVAGNHEYWDGDLADVPGALRAATRGSQVHFLECGRVVIGGVRFLGCTLWADYRGADPAVSGEAEARFNDFRRISHGGRPVRAVDLVAVHRRSRRWLERALAEPFAGPTVVVTHHAPSYRSWPGPDKPAKYVCSSDLGDLMARHPVDLWIHGHVHHVLDYVHNGVRVVCNPRGYVGRDEPNGFKANRTEVVQLESVRHVSL